MRLRVVKIPGLSVLDAVLRLSTLKLSRILIVNTLLVKLAVLTLTDTVDTLVSPKVLLE